MTLSRYKTLTLSTLILGGLGMVTAPLLAQQTANGPRGVQLRLGVALGLESQSNRALDPSNPGSSSEAVIDFSLGVLSETRTQRLSFDVGGELRNTSRPTLTNSGFENPYALLSYDRSSAAARLSLSASLRDTDLNDNDFDFDLGEITTSSESEAFTFVDGTATRRNTNLSARLDWRDDAPLGFGVLARLEKNSFSGGTATGVDGTTLNDTQRLTLGVSARLDINDATRLESALNFSQFEQDGVAGTRDTWTLSNRLTVDQPRGGLTFGLSITDTVEGTRYAANVGRSLEYPLGVVSGRIGITRGVAGETFLNGGLNLTRALPRGNLTLALSRSVSSGALEDTEQLSTTLRVGYLHELSPLASLSFGADWAQVSRTGSGIDTTSASITATYRRELTSDWGMNVGVRHRFRDDGVTGSARSNEVFLNLSREFLTRF